MEISNGQGNLIRIWYQEVPKNPYEYRIMLRFFCYVQLVVQGQQQ